MAWCDPADEIKISIGDFAQCLRFVKKKVAAAIQYIKRFI